MTIMGSFSLVRNILNWLNLINTKFKGRYTHLFNTLGYIFTKVNKYILFFKENNSTPFYYYILA